MKETAGYLPDIGEETIQTTIITFQNKQAVVEAEIPVLTAAQMRILMKKVKAASAETLKSFSVSDIAAIIDQTIARFLDREFLYRQKAEQLLPVVTGYDAEIIRLGLTSYLKNFRQKELQRFLVEDFGNPLLLDGFQPRAKGGFSKAVAPDLITHIWAGNVPALPLWSFVSGLLVKAGNIGKVPSAEPFFAGWFARTLVEVEPRLADCLAVVWWKGGDEAREQAVFSESDTVIGYGGNSSLQSLQSRMPITTRFLPFGHKISFGAVSKTVLNSQKSGQTVRKAALDVVRYEQQGCYSPHLFYVQKGGRISPREFARMLASELGNLQIRFPRRELSLEESAMAAAWRQQKEMAVFSQKGTEVLGNSATDWTVAFEEGALSFAPSSLNRAVKVQSFETIEELLPVIAPHRSFLQTAGIAASPEELFDWSECLSKTGVTRITAIGAMTAPEAGWHHDGRFNLLDLVNMVDIEAAAEQESEQFASYAD